MSFASNCCLSAWTRGAKEKASWATSIPATWVFNFKFRGYRLDTGFSSLFLGRQLIFPYFLCVKGAIARDLRLLVFVMNQIHVDPCGLSFCWIWFFDFDEIIPYPDSYPILFSYSVSNSRQLSNSKIVPQGLIHPAKLNKNLSLCLKNSGNIAFLNNPVGKKTNLIWLCQIEEESSMRMLSFVS